MFLVGFHVYIGVDQESEDNTEDTEDEEKRGGSRIMLSHGRDEICYDLALILYRRESI